MPKRSAKTERKLTVAYLYSNGTLVELYAESRGGVELGETVDITLGYCRLYISRYKADAASDGYRGKDAVPHGRIVLHHVKWGYDGLQDGFLALAKGGKIEATMPSVWEGSENTRKRNLEVQYVRLTTKGGLTFSWCDCTSVICSQFTVQDTSAEWTSAMTVAPGDRWGNARVWSVRDLRPMEDKTTAEVA